ncbi:MFS transporter [Clostridium oryzae]|uniref:Purine efflux pump PbuE n=1 Tax=Clostridium oryzae TaxID=1450648 RepID=A0A1V4IVF2_9CLOT|nr:MFS transporter [Clostridium oryzae]OPJ64012.1 purine efflux pump PbuE [Clostridium oryzae]
MKKRLIITLLFSIFFLLGCDTFIVSPLVPLIASSFNIAASSGGYLVTAYSILYVIFSPLLGPISDKVGRKKMMVIGTFIFSIASLATGIAPNYILTIIARAFTGVGAACAAPNVWAYIGDYFDYKERGRVTAIIASALSLGMILGVPIGSFLAQLMHWETCFYVLAVVSFLVSISIYAYFPDKKTTDSSNTNYLHQFIKVFKVKSVVFSFLVTLFIAVANLGLYTFLGFWLDKQFNLKVSDVGLFLIFAGFGNVCGVQLGGILSDKFSKKKTIIASSLLLVTALILLPIFGNNIFLAAIDVFLWLGSGGAAFSVMQVLITQLSSAQRGTVMAVNNSFMWLGTASGSAIVSFLIAHFNFAAATSVCALSALIASVILAVFIHECISIKESV